MQKKAVLGLLLAVSSAQSLVAPAPEVVPGDGAARLISVRRIHAGLSKVLQTGHLGGGLGDEAKRVDEEALAAIASSAKSSNRTALSLVITDYEHWMQHLQRREGSLRREESASAPPRQLLRGASWKKLSKEEKAKLDAREQELLSGLEERAQRVVAHLRADASKSAQEAEVIQRLEAALAPAASEQMDGRVLQLHSALAGAQDVLKERAAALSVQEARLQEDIQEQRSIVLYGMLKQRRRLPMASQVALLRRQQFANSTCGQQLLRFHTSETPLYEQLERLLPQALAQRLHSKEGSKQKEHLAVAGSDGRVHIVSSRMKETVKKMAAELAEAEQRLKDLVRKPPPSISVHEIEQAREIAADLDGVLKNVTATRDLKTQLDNLDEMQKHLARWMKAATPSH